MADEGAARYRDTERGEALFDHLRGGHAVGARRAVGEFADDDAAHTLEDARDQQCRQHAIDAVGALGDVLDEKDAASRRPEATGGSERVDQREVAAPERPSRDAMAHAAEATQREGAIGG